MRKYLFTRANWLIMNDQVEILTETDHSVRLKVGKCEVVAKYQNHELIWLCNCKQGASGRTCQHVLAAMTHLTLNKKWQIYGWKEN